MSLQLWIPFDGQVKNYGLQPSKFTLENIEYSNDGKIGKSAIFQNTSNVKINNSPLNGTLSDFSIAFWVKASNTISGTIYQMGASTVLQITNGTIYFNNTSLIKIANNIWEHYCLVKKQNLLTVYKNGNKISDFSVDIYNIYTEESYIGKKSFRGNLTDFRVYDNAISIKMVKEISRGLLLQYQLKNNTFLNTTVTDVSGYAHNGQLIGTKINSTNTQRYNEAVIFNNTSTKIKTVLPVSLNSTSFTIAWRQKTDSINISPWVFGDDAEYSFLFTGNKIGISNQYWFTQNASNILNNQWHHFALVANQTNLLLYIDGDLVGNTSYLAPQSTIFIINGLSTSSFTSNGLALSDFRIYTTALTANDIKGLSENVASIDNENNLFAYEFIEQDNQNPFNANGVVYSSQFQESNSNLKIYNQKIENFNFIEF